MPHCCHSQSKYLTSCIISISFAADNRSNVRTTTTIVKHLIQTSMRKNASSRTMDEDLKIFLGIKPEVEEQKPALAGMPAQEHEDVQAGTDENMNEQTGETVQENTDGSPQVIHRVSGKQRRASLEEYKAMFLPIPSIEDRKPVFLSRDTRDALDRIVSLFGSRRMSVSGLMENIARHHLATYREDIEAWRKL